ncbi:MAG: hypothetical protein ACKVZJ_08865 [Phycisphaerales bacterium]
MTISMNTTNEHGGMNSNRRRSGRVNFAVMLAACGLGVAMIAAGPARGQDAGAPRSAPVADPLGGPKVVDRAPPGERAFGEQPQGKGNAKFARRGAPHGMFIRALQGLEGDLAVTDEQHEQIKAIEEEFRAQLQAFRAEHQEEIAELRAQAGMGKARGALPDRPADAERPGTPERRGDRPGRGRPDAEKDLSPEAQEARTKLKALMESAPKADEFQTRQWAVLNQAQQDAVKGTMQDMREAIQRGEMRRGDRAGKREGGPRAEMRREGRGGPEAGPGGPGARRGPGGPDGRGPEGRGREEMRRHRGGPDGPDGPGGPGRRGGRGGPDGPGGPGGPGVPPPPPPADDTEEGDGMNERP